ncbi:MAG: hypothetical protein RBU24_15850, partial [Kiritimatiellia bacterium]|nr:hypothetical protein [Kiritimatiellia bacterium]
TPSSSGDVELGSVFRAGRGRDERLLVQPLDMSWIAAVSGVPPTLRKTEIFFAQKTVVCLRPRRYTDDKTGVGRQ